MGGEREYVRVHCTKYKAIIPIQCCLLRQIFAKTKRSQFSKCLGCYLGLKIRLNPSEYLDNDVFKLKYKYPFKFLKYKLKIKKKGEEN